MLRRFARRWLPASAAVLLVVPACAQRPAAPAADITFALRDADRSATWPVAVREVAIDGKPIRLNRPVRLQGPWLRTVTITLRNVSPKTIVRGGIGLVFPESGDGSAAHPYEACWSEQGRVPKIVFLAHDGYHLPPRLRPAEAVPPRPRSRPSPDLYLWRRCAGHARQQAHPPGLAHFRSLLFCRQLPLVRPAIRPAATSRHPPMENGHPQRIPPLRAGWELGVACKEIEHLYPESAAYDDNWRNQRLTSLGIAARPRPASTCDDRSFTHLSWEGGALSRSYS